MYSRTLPEIKYINDASITTHADDRNSLSLVDPFTISVNWSMSLNNRLRSLNEEFLSLGLQMFLQSNQGESKSSIQFNSLVDSTYILFERYLHNLNTHNSADDSLLKITADLELSRRLHERVKADLLVARTALNQAKEQHRIFETEKHTLACEVRKLKNTVNQLQAINLRSTNHHKHEINKRDSECLDLHKKLSAYMREFPNRPPRIAAGERVAAETCINQPSSDDYETKVQLDLSQSAIVQLQNREHDLLSENRELRDLVGILLSRMFRFSRFCDAIILNTKQFVQKNSNIFANYSTSSQVEEYKLSRNEFNDNSNTSMLDPESTDSTSSDYNNSEENFKSDNFMDLLLEMPYSIVREKVNYRVQEITRNLWKRLKLLSNQLPFLPVIKTYKAERLSDLASREIEGFPDSENASFEISEQAT